MGAGEAFEALERVSVRSGVPVIVFRFAVHLTCVTWRSTAR
jgi:hypothetical protein